MNWSSKHFLFMAMIHCAMNLLSYAETTLDWWQTDVIYQIYPRSFKDSDGDGVGDLNGITEKADYLQDLGVGGIWISPIFKSPMADFGYDISDYRSIDPLFGTMDDFVRLVDEYHSRDIKVILDFVPNHTSDEHEWFRKSEQGIDPYTDYYVWVPAKLGENGTRSPPNNWLSFFEGPAWEWSDARHAYYLHQFHKKQPDLNYQNPVVLQEMKDVIKFWLDLSVDGFRVDTAMTLCEDCRYLDEPRSFEEGIEPTNHNYLNHIYTIDQPESYDVIYEFRALLDTYSGAGLDTKLIMVEATTNMNTTMLWYGNETVSGAHFPFNFLLLTDVDRQSTARDFSDALNTWYQAMPDGEWANWVIGNHDNSRAASRFGRDMMDSIHIMQLVLPGTAITYMADEIAMEDPFITWAETVDPQGINVGERLYESWSRDPERSPFQWNNAISAGFSTNWTTWLPVHPEYWNYNLEEQLNSKKSHLSVYKSLLQLKNMHIIQEGSLKVHAPTEDILVIERFSEPASMFVAVINVGSFYQMFDLTNYLLLPPDQNWRVYASSLNCEHLEEEVVDTSELKLRPKAAVLLTNMEVRTASALTVSPSTASPTTSQSGAYNLIEGSLNLSIYIFSLLFFFSTRWRVF